MDPVIALEEFDKAILEKDRPYVWASADNLVVWLEKGGFSPFTKRSDDWRSTLPRPHLIAYFKMAREIAAMD